MSTDSLDRKPRSQTGVMALIASVVVAMVLAVGCGQSVQAAPPAGSGGSDSAHLAP